MSTSQPSDRALIDGDPELGLAIGETQRAAAGAGAAANSAGPTNTSYAGEDTSYGVGAASDSIVAEAPPAGEAVAGAAALSSYADAYQTTLAAAARPVQDAPAAQTAGSVYQFPVGLQAYLTPSVRGAIPTPGGRGVGALTPRSSQRLAASPLVRPMSGVHEQQQALDYERGGVVAVGGRPAGPGSPGSNGDDGDEDEQQDPGCVPICVQMASLWGTYRAELAELFGVYVLVLLAQGTLTRMKVLGASSVGPVVLYMTIGLSLALSIFLTMGASGGHVNPIVTLSLAICRRFPWKRVPSYILAQTLGGFLAAVTVFLSHQSVLLTFSRGDLITPDAGMDPDVAARETASIFVLLPDQPGATHLSQFVADALASTLLVLVVLTCTSARGHVARATAGGGGGGGLAAPLAIGAAAAALVPALGVQAGPAFNPAADLGPRVALLALGYGRAPFTAFGGACWVPTVAPFVGSVLGTLLYRLFVEEPVPLGPVIDRTVVSTLERGGRPPSVVAGTLATTTKGISHTAAQLSLPR